ncbi:helix-turn-helix domain-containing protein [Lipingzhangella sp. LS1_29]|uniref:Helix-turn-helix domain-containing protein n=1 Tax=Lipingzhangella rawalii TaxID=2055835 RepID=A0ABU2H5Z2_9ACTN|nr:helix-turn-helix domain-containing protein [Lipingzhangella rawalii]MDA8372610.1 helix-turn-helix domain-containing protein [Nocardiopsaceae bacterium]MDS1270437.1 helix-turn-helix domain-containing protein [Lipingzhangella rawalii]
MTPLPTTRRLLTVPEVMDVLRLGRWKVYELIRSGRLESVKIGRDRRIPTEALDSFISELREEAA